MSIMVHSFNLIMKNSEVLQEKLPEKLDFCSTFRQKCIRRPKDPLFLNNFGIRTKVQALGTILWPLGDSKAFRFFLFLP